VEMQDLEVVADVSLDLRIGKMNEMHAFARGAAFQPPHDRETLAPGGSGREILGKVEETLQVPIELVETILIELGRCARGRHVPGEQTGTGGHEQPSSGQHLPSPRWHKYANSCIYTRNDRKT